jgi:hypothetical protein
MSMFSMALIGSHTRRMGWHNRHNMIGRAMPGVFVMRSVACRLRLFMRHGLMVLVLIMAVFRIGHGKLLLVVRHCSIFILGPTVE